MRLFRIYSPFDPVKEGLTSGSSMHVGKEFVMGSGVTLPTGTLVNKAGRWFVEKCAGVGDTGAACVSVSFKSELRPYQEPCNGISTDFIRLREHCQFCGWGSQHLLDVKTLTVNGDRGAVHGISWRKDAQHRTLVSDEGQHLVLLLRPETGFTLRLNKLVYIVRWDGTELTLRDARTVMAEYLLRSSILLSETETIL